MKDLIITYTSENKIIILNLKIKRKEIKKILTYQ